MDHEQFVVQMKRALKTLSGFMRLPGPDDASKAFHHRDVTVSCGRSSASERL
jgi:hypothetical protein